MADFFPFDSGQGSNVTEAQWGLMAKNWLGTGVIKGAINEHLVYADSSGMQVKVEGGNAWIQGFFFQTTTETVLPISPADATNPRIDRVAIQVDWTNNNISLIVLQGTPATSPVPPVLTQSSAIYQMSLAQVAVGANVSTIASGNITDERLFANVKPHFSIIGGLWSGGISSANVFLTMPAYLSVTSPVASVLKYGFHNSSYDIVAESSGKYYLSALVAIGGLNNLQKFDVGIRVTKASTGATTDVFNGIYGYQGLGGNNTAPEGINCFNNIIVDLAVGDKITFLVTCSETPRDINRFILNGMKISE